MLCKDTYNNYEQQYTQSYKYTQDYPEDCPYYDNLFKKCTDSCDFFVYLEGDQKICTITCDYVVLENGTALPYGQNSTDGSDDICVEECQYHWIYASFIRDHDPYNMQCIQNSSCQQKGYGIRYLNISNNQCVEICTTQYIFNYYADDDSDDITNLYACSKYNDTCNGSIASNGTEMKYLQDAESTNCIDVCQYEYWYQLSAEQAQICVTEENANCYNLYVDNVYYNVYYTSINAEDKQCVSKQNCIESGYQYVMKDDQCFYYKSLNECQQFSQIEEYSTYIIQSTEKYQCVEKCNDIEYFFLNETEDNQKTCIASCSQISNEYKADDNTRECIKNSNDDNNDNDNKKKSNTGLIVGVTVGAVVVIAVIVIAVVLVVKKKSQNKKEPAQVEPGKQQMVKNKQNIYI